MLHTIIYYFSTTFLFRAVFILSSWAGVNAVYVAVFALLIVPVFTYIAILRYRLYDIDVVINRTRLRCSERLYRGYVRVRGGSPWGTLPGAGQPRRLALGHGLVAVAFQPLRGRLQRGVNRLMYGERDDPYAVISRLGKRLEAALAPEAVLPTLVETIAQALKLPYAAILLKEGEGFRTAAAYGSPRGEPETLPLVYQREEIGRLYSLQGHQGRGSRMPTAAFWRTSPDKLRWLCTL